MAKKTYSAPQLKVYGDVAAITKMNAEVLDFLDREFPAKTKKQELSWGTYDS